MPPALAVWTYPRIDPVILELPGPLALRWYGMMYLVGFWVGYLILHRMAQRGRLAVPPDMVSQIVGWIAAGVFVGGRLGYILFYQPAILQSPGRILAVWEGGLSFHGGLLGVIAAVWMYSRRLRRSFLGVADGLVLATCPGILAVRCANFINGELYGRITTDAVPWAMRFPTDPVVRRALGLDTSAADVVYAAVTRAQVAGTWDGILAQAPLRHPSQIYEAALEGIVLFALLWAVVGAARRLGWKLPQGTFFALFLVGYAAARSTGELFRQPDLQFTSTTDPVGYVLGPLTMGQVLSAGIALLGVAIIAVNALGRGPGGTAWAVRPAGEPTLPVPDAADAGSRSRSAARRGGRSASWAARRGRKRR